MSDARCRCGHEYGWHARTPDGHTGPCLHPAGVANMDACPAYTPAPPPTTPREESSQCLACLTDTELIDHTCKAFACCGEWHSGPAHTPRDELADEIAAAEQRGREDNADHGMCYVAGSKALAGKLADAWDEGYANCAVDTAVTTRGRNPYRDPPAPAATPPTTAERIAGVLMRHQRIPLFNDKQGQRCIGCDNLYDEPDGPNSPRHVTHVATVIAALFDAGEG